MTPRGPGHKGRARPVRYPWGGAGLRRIAWGALVALLPASPAVGQAPPPDGAWTTVESEHFRVTYPAGLDDLGREVAARAERAWDRLAEAFVGPPPGRTEILLTDHVDVSNGSARVTPFKQITVFARPPVDGFGLSHFDDWLELVLTHELAHVFHLDVSGPLGRLLRGVFGQVPAPWPFFPQLGTPRWAIEGIATWYESALSESGRVRGSYHDMVIRTAALEGRFEGIDQASGESPVWPDGERPYIYGSLFFDHLLRAYGPRQLGAFVEAVGDQIVPYRLDAAAKDAFGVSFSDAWDAWREETRERAAALEVELAARQALTETEAVTRGARAALHARVAPDGRTLVYARADGRSDSQLRRALPDGAEDETLMRTNGTAAFSFAPDGRIVLSQLELEDPYRLYGDLWVREVDGTTRRITRGMRLDHPSVGPDGEAAVAIQVGEGTTRLVEVDLASGEVRPLGPFRKDVHWAYPAVSPDGRTVAAARWTPGAYFDVVLVDRSTGRVVTRVTADRALDTAPAWSPDGRWLVWSSDRSGIPNLLAAEIDARDDRVLRTLQVTNLLTGAQFPSVSPDGRWLHFSAYHADGWEIERLPFEPDRFFEPFPLALRFSAPDSVPGVATVRVDTALQAHDYDPLPTLRPRFWEPVWAPAVRSRGVDVIEPSLGVLTSAEDLVGRHAVDARLLVSLSDSRVSGSVGYAYRGLGNPVLSARVGQGWDAGARRAIVDQDTVDLFLVERERNASLAATFLRRRFRHSLSLTLSGGMAWEGRSLLEADLSESELRLARPDVRLTDFRASAGFSTARGHAFSVSAEEGLSLSVTGRTRDELDVPADARGILGLDRSVDELYGQLRGYLDLPGPGFADHVLALRLSAGLARGPGADPSHYDVGGVSGGREPFTGLGLFGGSARFFPVRGFESGDRSGREAWSATLEYRFPLALVNEGLGLIPIHLDRVSGAVFLDAGNAWGPEEGGRYYRDNLRRDALASAGLEVLTDVLTLFSIPVTLRGGVAFPLTVREGAVGYVSFGRPF